MSIEFHCDHCARLIRAPEKAAGRRGVCPFCKQSVYVPTPPEEIEEIPLASGDADSGAPASGGHPPQGTMVPPPDSDIEEIPIAPVDSKEEAARRRLERESLHIDRQLRADTRPPPERSSDRTSAHEGGIGALPEPHADATDRVVEYLLAMGDARLTEADEILADLRRNKAAGRAAIDRIAADAVPPPELAHMPPAVVQGFLRNLSAQLR